MFKIIETSSMLRFKLQWGKMLLTLKTSKQIIISYMLIILYSLYILFLQKMNDGTYFMQAGHLKKPKVLMYTPITIIIFANLLHTKYNLKILLEKNDSRPNIYLANYIKLYIFLF